MCVFPNGFIYQVRFCAVQHFTESLVQEERPALDIRTDDPGGRLIDNRAEALLRFAQGLFSLLAICHIHCDHDGMSGWIIHDCMLSPVDAAIMLRLITDGFPFKSAMKTRLHFGSNFLIEDLLYGMSLDHFL